MKVLKRSKAFEVRLNMGSRKGYGEEQYASGNTLSLHKGCDTHAALSRAVRYCSRRFLIQEHAAMVRVNLP